MVISATEFCILFFFLLHQAENIMLLELDMTPPTLFQIDFPNLGSEMEPSRDVQLDNALFREKVAASRVRKSQSWSVWHSFSRQYGVDESRRELESVLFLLSIVRITQ